MEGGKRKMKGVNFGDKWKNAEVSQQADLPGWPRRSSTCGRRPCYEQRSVKDKQTAQQRKVSLSDIKHLLEIRDLLRAQVGK